MINLITIIQNEDIIHMAKKPAKTAASKVKNNGGEKVLRSRGKRKLNNDQVFAIVKAYAAPGVTMKMVAAQFDISVGTVQAIVSGKTYKWLTGIGVGVPATKKTRGKVAPIAAPAEIGAEAAFV